MGFGWPLKVSKTTHQKSNCSCLVYHGDGEGPCIWCPGCHEMIRPSKLKEECYGIDKRDQRTD